MHAVGDRADRHLGLVEGRPEAVKHVAADVAVQPRDAVGALREPEPHHRHVEDGRVAAGVVLGAEGEQLVDRHAGRGAVLAEVLLHEGPREPVDAGRHGGVRREDRGRAAHLERGVPVDLRAALLHGELADPLDAEEARVALVGVEHLGRRMTGEPAEHPQRPDAADAQQQLLSEPVLAVAAVEAVGHVDVVLGVALDVGVQHQQRDPPDPHHPDARDQRRPVGQVDRDGGAGAVGLAEQRDRQTVGVKHRVALLLPALAGERLLEVAVPVEQADADDRDAEVAGGLEVVAGEDAEAAGVLRQHRGDAELGREVADRARSVLDPALVPPVLGEVRREVALDRAEPLAELTVGRELVEARRLDRTEQADRIASGRLPQLGVDRGEDVLGGRVPGPPQVVGQVSQRRQGLGEHGADGESSDGAHPQTLACALGSFQASARVGFVVDQSSHVRGRITRRGTSR